MIHILRFTSYYGKNNEADVFNLNYVKKKSQLYEAVSISSVIIVIVVLLHSRV